MAEISWTKQALQDLESVGDYIARDAPEIAQIFVDRIVESISRLQAFPFSGRIVSELSQENIREIIFRNYRIVYLVKDNNVNIL